MPNQINTSPSPQTPYYINQTAVLCGSPDNVIQVIPVVTAGLYSANNSVGGVQTLSTAVRSNNNYGILESVTVVDKSQQSAQLSIFFFNANPLGTYTDHGAVTVNVNDATSLIGKVDIGATTYDNFGTYSVATVSGLALLLQGDTKNSVYAVATTTGTPSYASASALIFNYGILRS